MGECCSAGVPTRVGGPLHGAQTTRNAGASPAPRAHAMQFRYHSGARMAATPNIGMIPCGTQSLRSIIPTALRKRLAARPAHLQRLNELRDARAPAAGRSVSGDRQRGSGPGRFQRQPDRRRIRRSGRGAGVGRCRSVRRRGRLSRRFGAPIPQDPAVSDRIERIRDLPGTGIARRSQLDVEDESHRHAGPRRRARRPRPFSRAYRRSANFPECR